MTKKIISCFLFIGFYLFTGIVFWGEHTYMLIANLVFAYIASFYIFSKSNNTTVDYLLLNAPFFGLLFFSCLIGNNFSIGLSYLIFTPIASFIGFLGFKTKKILFSTITTLLITIGAFYFQSNYFSFYHNKNAEVNVAFPNVQLLDKNGKHFQINNDKVIVLDFWSSSCGICFKKFPSLEKTYLKYKNNPKIEIYALNVPLKNEELKNRIKILDSIGYRFPKIYAKSSKEIESKLNINAFPHLLIIKNGKIRYNGMYISDKNTFYNTESEIEKLLNE
jgi:thiol-disulfide isomerase/thioredoxin